MRRFARRMVRLYPGAWRERYEEEFAAMIEEMPVTPATLLDIVRGAFDARMRPQISDGRLRMAGRLRASVLAVLWGWVGLVVASVGFRKMTEYGDFVRAARQSAWVGLSLDVVVAGAVLALAAILIGGMPIVFAALRGALAERRRDVPLLFCVPPLCLGLFVGYVLLVTRVVYPAIHPAGVHSPLNVAIFLSIVGAFVLAAVVSAGAVSAAMAHVELGERPLGFALYSAGLVVLAMGLVLASTLVWGLALKIKEPGLFSGSDGILSTSTAATWLVILAVMAVSTAVAARAVVRGFSVHAGS